MGWWKADPVQAAEQPNILNRPTPEPQTQAPTTPAPSCPVDSQTREIWLRQARQSQKPEQQPIIHPPVSVASSTFAASPSEDCSSDRIDQSVTRPSRSQASASIPSTSRVLSTDRVVSTIPRAFVQWDPPLSERELATSRTPNSETWAAAHQSGNWVYPSEAQFFQAVLRKHSPESLLPPETTGKPSPPTRLQPNNKPKRPKSSATDDLASTIPTIIPIHNAVNERAWSLIKDWEKSFDPVSPVSNTQDSPTAAGKPPQNPPPCTGPKLLSFRGLGSSTSSLSPKAWFNSLLGYTTPFDRHDWVVQRCDGSRIEYIIDFYTGSNSNDSSQKSSSGTRPSGGGNLNFYLDVRPKLNSMAGVKMNVGRWCGFG